MSNIEKDIEKLESIVKVHNDFLKGVKKETINEREIKAIENVLAERKQDKERIKELEENSIKKDKLIELIDFAVNATGHSNAYTTGMCNGLLYIKSVITETEPTYFKWDKSN